MLLLEMNTKVIPMLHVVCSIYKNVEHKWSENNNNNYGHMWSHINLQHENTNKL